MVHVIKNINDREKIRENEASDSSVSRQFTHAYEHSRDSHLFMLLLQHKEH